MKKNALLFLACFVMPLMALAEPYGEQIPTADFFQSIQGDYTILKAGGAVPPAEDTEGSVSHDTLSTRFTFPYCIPNGACFLGVTNFKHLVTLVYRATSPDMEIYTIVQGLKKYQWEVSRDKTVFRNMQFNLTATQTIVLEMEVKRN